VHTDMRRGMNGLALQVQEGLQRDPHAGDLFVFRGAPPQTDKTRWFRKTELPSHRRRPVPRAELDPALVAVIQTRNLALLFSYPSFPRKRM
jgi:IS66 Orf2 like protein